MALVFVGLLWMMIDEPGPSPDPEPEPTIYEPATPSTVSSPAAPPPPEPSTEPSSAKPSKGPPPSEPTRVAIAPPRADAEPVPYAAPSAPVFSPDGESLAWIAGGEGRYVRLGRDGGRPLVGARGEVTALAWDSAGLRWLTGDRRGRLRVWIPPESEDPVPPAPIFEILLTGLEDPVDRVAWSQAMIAATAGGRLWLWESEGRRLVASWPGHDRPVSTLVFRHDGRALLSADESGGLRLWAPSGRKLEDFTSEGLTAVAAAGFDPYGWAVAWARDERGRWGLWRSAGGWWWPEDPSTGPGSPSIAAGGSHVLWTDEHRADLWSLADEERHPLRAFGPDARAHRLSPGAELVAWIEGEEILVRRLPVGE